MQISVATEHGRCVPLIVEANDSIAMVKVKIQERTGIIAYQQRLTFAGKQLDDGQHVSDYDISVNDEIAVARRLAILVKAATGKITTLDVKPSDGIENVMGKIQNEEGTPHLVVETGYWGKNVTASTNKLLSSRPLFFSCGRYFEVKVCGSAVFGSVCLLGNKSPYCKVRRQDGSFLSLSFVTLVRFAFRRDRHSLCISQPR